MNPMTIRRWCNVGAAVVERVRVEVVEVGAVEAGAVEVGRSR